MLTIRPEQLKAFGPKTPEEVATVLYRYALENHWDIVKHMPDMDLVACVKSAMARAAKYGLQDVGPLTHFFYVMLRLAPNFDEHPKIRQILTNSSLAKHEVVPSVVEETTEETWQAVVDNFDATAWHFGLS